MGLNNVLWTVGPATYYADGSPGVTTKINSITRARVANNAEVIADLNPGTYWPERANVKSVKPQAELATKDVLAALDVCGANGLCVGGANHFSVNANRRTCNDIDAGSVHTAYRMNQGILYPQQLRATHQEDAELTFGFLASYNGSVAPVVIIENQPAVLQTIATNRYTLGPVEIGGITFDCKTEMAVDFGLQTRARGCDSEFYDSAAMIVGSQPRFTLTGLNPAWAKGDTSGAVDLVTGLIASHANTTIWFRNRGAADNVTAHLSLTMYGQSVIDDIFSVSGNDDGTVSLSLYGAFDGTNSPVVLATGAIS